MAAPTVRKLNNLIAEQKKALDPQFKLIDSDIAANAKAGAAQEEGLKATQQQVFGQIEQAAQDKGMFFSGFTPDAQAQYTASTYLPALANLQAQIAQTRSNLLGKKADLNTSAYDKAFQTREGDISRRFQFTERVEGQKFQTSERKRGQKFTAGQNAKDRAFRASESAKDRAATAANRASSAIAAIQQGAPSGLTNSVFKLLEKNKGKDEFVSPATYHSGLKKWLNAGGSPDSYNQTFGGYVNPRHQEKWGGYY